MSKIWSICKRSFTPKTHQMFSVHTRPEKFENAAVIGHFAFCLSKTQTGECHDDRNVTVFEKLCFHNFFPSTAKTQS